MLNAFWQYLTPLNAKKFRKLNAKKDDVVRAFYQLEGSGKSLVFDGNKRIAQVS